MGNLFKDTFNMEKVITEEKREVEFGLKTGKTMVIIVKKDEVEEILKYYRGFIRGTFKDEVISNGNITFHYGAIEYIKLGSFIAEERRVPIREVF